MPLHAVTCEGVSLPSSSLHAVTHRYTPLPARASPCHLRRYMPLHAVTCEGVSLPSSSFRRSARRWNEP
eukprot:5684088-Prymnesium_polylepis.1